MSDEERLARLRLIRSPSIGAKTFWDLIARFGSACAAIPAWRDFARASDRPRQLVTLDAVRREFEALAAAGGVLIACGEPGYPSALAAAEQPPPLLAVRGSPDLLRREMIAIVGARNASALGARFAREMAAELGQAGFVVASGLARGIDTAAHKGSLASGTCAVMAGGVDIVYPPENRKLYDAIAASGTGVVVSEMPFGYEPAAQNFPRRNRIISGLARGVVVVEAAMNSGSLITARLAGEQGREVFAVPGSPLDPRAKGTNGLIRQGAVLTETAEDVVSALRPSLEHRRPAAPALTIAAPRETSDLKREILQRLGASPVEIDELVRQMGAAPAAVAAALLDLEFEGRLNRNPGQKVVLRAG
jgi:DNA processing protein